MKTAIAFLSGQALTCLLVIAGARSPLSVGIIAGAITAALAALTFARPTARLLNTLADAGATFTSAWTATTKTVQPSVTAAAGKSKVSTVPTVSQLQQEVISAYRNLGDSQNKATKRVLAAGEAADFETLFRKAAAL